MSRLLITGGSSYLGQHLVPRALEQSTGQGDVVYTYFSDDPLALPQGRQLDLRDRGAVARLISEVAPTQIIHTAGSNRSPDMESVIVEGASGLTDAARPFNSRIVHISTDVVFDGLQAPYREPDPPQPMHAYGRAKVKAENIVARYPNHVIVRTSLIYGLEMMDRGTGWVVNALRARKPVTLFTDQFRNPIWVESLSRALLELAGTGAAGRYQGILHLAGAQRLSRAAFAKKMLDWWQVEERDGLSFGSCDGERWPLDCTLNIELAQSLLHTPLPGVDHMLGIGQSQR